MDRKDFIKSASILIGGTLSSSFVPGKQTTSKEYSLILKKSIGYGMIKEDMTITDKMKLAKDIGFDGLEFKSPVDSPLKEIVKAKEKSNIQLPSFINKDHWSKPLSSPDASVRQYTIDSISRSLEEAKVLGGDTVLVVPGVVNEKISYQQAYDNSLKSIRKLIPQVEKTGIKIGLENVWNNFILSPIEAKNFVDTIDHPLIGWYLDIGNILRYGWPEHWIEILKDRIFKLHVKGFSRKKMNDEGLWDGFVDLLEGDINWPGVIKELKDIQYSGKWMRAEVKGGDRKRLSKISGQMDKIIALSS